MEISKAEVIRRLREAGFGPDPEPVIKRMLPEPRGLASEETPTFVPAGPETEFPYARPRIHDPKGEPWMIWVRQHWSTQDVGPFGGAAVTTHLKFAAAPNQRAYRMQGHWEVGIAIPGLPEPDELIYAVERELSDLAGRSIRVSHLDGRAVA